MLCSNNERWLFSSEPMHNTFLQLKEICSALLCYYIPFKVDKGMGWGVVVSAIHLFTENAIMLLKIPSLPQFHPMLYGFHMPSQNAPKAIVST